MTHDTTVTVVRSRSVLGEILVDKSMDENSIRIYRIDAAGNTSSDVVLTIPFPAEKQHG